MLVPDAPSVVQQWLANPPSWLSVQSVPVIDLALNSLDLGEQAAITLAQKLPADLLLIDERLGRQMAVDRKLSITGTIGVLDEAAKLRLINLADALNRLQQTNFRISRRLIQALLQRPSI
jgi:predicted nucleic acid-binding protein